MSASRSPLFQGKFGRMFRSLPPATYGETEDQTNHNLTQLALAMKSDADPVKDGKDEEESGIPALYTYFGQFIDHDLTFDPASSLQKQNDPGALTDFRTPAFDLDCVYGRGPDDQPYMYGNDGEFIFGVPLRNGHRGARDLPRFLDSIGPLLGRALIGDPRNDENAIVSQLHGLFLRFHNRLLAESGLPFGEVQRLVRFHYQYVILNDFLPRVVHPSVLNQLQTNGMFDRRRVEFYRWRNDPFMPVEFSGAAYRFGHSLVRPGYRMNDLKLLPIFPDLAGFRPMDPELGMDWGRFIDIDVRSADETQPGVKEKRLQFAYRMDTSLVEPLANLPPSVAPTPPPALAERNLKRAFRLGLPSGQAVARFMGIRPLADEEIRIGKAVDDPEKPLPSILDTPGADPGVFADNCPLWTYILAEAMHFADKVPIPVKEQMEVTTPRLGSVGGRIVAEVIIGLMFGDPSSLLSLDRLWHPPSGPDYRLKDFVRYALGD
jgi:hypothetical protein